MAASKLNIEITDSNLPVAEMDAILNIDVTKDAEALRGVINYLETIIAHSKATSVAINVSTITSGTVTLGGGSWTTKALAF